MSTAIGLDRLPRSIAALFDEAAQNLAIVATRLDELVDGDASALGAIHEREDTGDRIVHDLVDAVRASRRDGPRRARLIVLGQAVDDVVDAVEALAVAWFERPLAVFGDVILSVRDAARDCAHAVAALEDPNRLEPRLVRCREREQQLRQADRAGRAWLLVEQSDPRTAVRGHELLERADEARRACVRLRGRLETYLLE